MLWTKNSPRGERGYHGDTCLIRNLGGRGAGGDDAITRASENAPVSAYITRDQLVHVVAVTADSPGSNRKAAKKSRLSFPVLSDQGGEWMLAYRVTIGGQREKMAFLIEPELGRVSLCSSRSTVAASAAQGETMLSPHNQHRRAACTVVEEE